MSNVRVIPLISGALAFISGVSALTYQVAWVKLLALTLGSTTIATAVVIGGFMGGMGLGARLYSAIPQWFANHFRRYGMIELGIAASAAAVTPLFARLPQLHAQAITGIGIVRYDDVVPFVTALLLILIPSALMGATFPALCAALIRSTRGVGRYVGVIYGFNTLGAAAGAILTGFVLIEGLGVRGACYVGIAGNAVCGLAAFVLSRREGGAGTVTEKSKPRLQVQSDRTGIHGDRRIIAVVLFGSGMATMAYEMFWIRILKYVVGNSTYAMSLVVTVFLIGLGGGGLIHHWLREERKTAELLAWTQLGTALLSLLALASVNWVLSDVELSRRFSILAPQIQLMPWWKSLVITSSFSTAVLLPPALLMGLTFPLGSGLYVERLQTLGTDLGKAYLIANAGSIVGVFLGALILLPAIGMMSATKAVAGLNVLLAGIVIAFLYRAIGKRAYVWIAGTAMSLVLAVMLPSQLAFRGELEGPGISRLLFWREDEIATVKVLQHPFGEARAMTVDGYVIGSGRAQQDAVVHKQLMLAHLPMALRPNARDILNVGLGSATTLDALRTYEKIETLSCVEISRAVVAGARLFQEGRVLDDPRIRVVVDDAVHFLLYDTSSYDLIISDCKQNFQYSGNASILSQEYYAYARTRLRGDGLFVQWIPMNLPPRAFRIVLATFIRVFPDADIHYFTPDLLLFVGGHGPITLPDSIPYAAFESSGARQDLSPFDIDDARQVLSGRVCGAEGLRSILGKREVNSWNHPLLEFVPYKEFCIQDNTLYNYLNLDLLDKAQKQEGNSDQRAVPGELGPFAASSNILREGLLEVFRTGRADAAQEACLRARDVNPADARPAIILRRITGGIRILLTPGSEVPSASVR